MVRPTLVVGVGASAGGLQAVQQLLAAHRPGCGVAWVVVLHLDPRQSSHLAEVLAQVTPMHVVEAVDGAWLLADEVHVIAPDTSLRVRDGRLVVERPRPAAARAETIDILLSSLAADAGPRAAGVVLSGAGDDGAAGLRDIKAAGGICLAQDPRTAEYASMPEHAIATDLVDHVLAPGDMAPILMRRAGGGADGDEVESDREVPPQLNAILEEVGRTRKLDFRGYKTGTLVRRTRRRMGLCGITSWADYLHRVLDDPGEAAALYGDLLIGVTRFFRDAESWEFLRQNVVPGLLRDRGGSALRAWVPACATGEEAYSVAMLLCKGVGDRYRTGDIQVLASDVDVRSIEVARRGTYPADIARDLSPERLERFFVHHGEAYQVSKELRAAITFCAHNLLSDPPFAKIDLVSCRNLLIYLEPQAQQHVLEVLHFALRPGGVLVLGSAETVGRHADMFEIVSKQWRVYRRVGASRAPRFHLSPSGAAALGSGGIRPASTHAQRAAQSLERLVRDWVLKRMTTACAVVNDNLELLYLFGPLERYLDQPVGELRTDILAWARPGLYAQLREALGRVREHGEPVTLEGLEIDRDGTRTSVRCTVEPFSPEPAGGSLLVVSFVDETDRPSRPADSAASDGPLARQLEQELRLTRRELDASLQQLSSSDEDHRASNEELLSLNEELQSSNEELETSKEELQSLNEEITRINAQLEARNAELEVINGDLQNFLASVEVPVLFLDEDLRIRRYTPAVADVMRVIASDVGRFIGHLKLRFVDDGLLEDAAMVLERLIPRSAEVVTDEGRWFVRRILPYRAPSDRIAGLCITFGEITAQKHATVEIEDARAYAEAIVATVPLPVLVVDDELRVVSANASFYARFGGTPAQTEGTLVYALGEREWDIPELRKLLEEVLPLDKGVDRFVIEHEFPNLGRRHMLLSARELLRSSGRRLVLLAIEDVTAYADADRQIRRQAGELLDEHRRKDEFLAMLGHELRNPLAAICNATDLLATARDDGARVDHLRVLLRRHAGRIVALVDQLLEVSRVISGKVVLRRQPLDLAGIVAEAAEAAAPLVRANAQDLQVLGPDSPVFVDADGHRLVQVVENLLTNAAKYSPHGGRIRVVIEPGRDEVSIAVRDEGLGIEPELLPRVFELFTQDRRSLDRARGGLGLGLPLARRLVEMHGGRLVAHSEGAGRGSEFVVTLPRVEGPALPTAAAKAVEHAPAPKPAPHRILVVDDEEDAATMLAEILGNEGHLAIAVHTAQAALEHAKSFAPDVVLLDLGLPGMDGYEAARRLRQVHGDGLFLVALTGYQADPARLADAGFDRHLIKPADLGKLARWLAQRR